MDNIVDSKTINFILTNVKLTNNIEGSELDALLTFYINKACVDITIQTNRNKFPTDLKYLVVDLTNDMYSQYIGNTDSEANQVIQSMSETGRSVNFGTSDISKSKLQLLLQKQLNEYSNLINKYKLLYKVRCPLENEQN